MPNSGRAADTPERCTPPPFGVQSTLAVGAQTYFVLGIEHICRGSIICCCARLPSCSRPLDVVKTITAFTVAHSITLAGAALGYFTLPQAPRRSHHRAQHCICRQRARRLGRLSESYPCLSPLPSGSARLRLRGGLECPRVAAGLLMSPWPAQLQSRCRGGATHVRRRRPARPPSCQGALRRPRRGRAAWPLPTASVLSRRSGSCRA